MRNLSDKRIEFLTLSTAILISVKRQSYIVISADTYALALFFVIVICLIGYTAIVLQKRGNEYRLSADRRLMEKKSTEFLDRNRVDDTCDICFGEFENGRVCECKCGMRFHEECAEMTGECPYCKERIGSMEVREIRKAMYLLTSAFSESVRLPYCSFTSLSSLSPSSAGALFLSSGSSQPMR